MSREGGVDGEDPQLVVREDAFDRGSALLGRQRRDSSGFARLFAECERFCGQVPGFLDVALAECVGGPAKCDPPLTPCVSVTLRRFSGHDQLRGGEVGGAAFVEVDGAKQTAFDRGGRVAQADGTFGDPKALGKERRRAVHLATRVEHQYLGGW